MKKNILITGASSGIGKETAKYFAGKGWGVAATMRAPEDEEELGGLQNVKLYKLDVTRSSEVAAAVRNIFSDFSRIDVLLNNAGYGAIGPFEKSTDEEIKNQFEVNVFGLMSLTREVLPYLRKQGSGIIINLSSVAGRLTIPTYSIYSASKWAVEGFAESLQYELKPFNIRVKNIEPGAINTDFHTRSRTLFENDEVSGYKELEKGMLNYMDKRLKSAPGPVVVAKTIYKAATDGKDKLRYPAGAQAKMALLSRGLIPTEWFMSAVQKMSDKIKKL